MFYLRLRPSHRRWHSGQYSQAVPEASDEDILTALKGPLHDLQEDIDQSGLSNVGSVIDAVNEGCLGEGHWVVPFFLGKYAITHEYVNGFLGLATADLNAIR